MDESHSDAIKTTDDPGFSPVRVPSLRFLVWRLILPSQCFTPDVYSIQRKQSESTRILFLIFGLQNDFLTVPTNIAESSSIIHRYMYKITVTVWLEVLPFLSFWIAITRRFRTLKTSGALSKMDLTKHQMTADFLNVR
ncbi:hypothetical protein ABKN59_009585 [Abortiporus biennis]